MYGTVARLRAKPGSQAELAAYSEEEHSREIAGLVADYVYQMDAASDEYYLAVVFDSKASYIANANSPEQDARYRRMRALLIADPEWHDGEVIAAHS
jgi:heme-degrading monooxygenase HmoA